MPGITLPRLRSPFRSRRVLASDGRGSSTRSLPMLPRQLEGAEHDASESTHEASGSSVGGIDHINVDQLRTALCAFLGIEEGGANTEFLNRYIQTFCAASAIMGEANTFGNILGQSEDEFHNTLQICRLISEQFEIEISTQQRLTVATDVQDDVVTIIPPAREAAINSLPFERVLPADRLNFQHDKTCCPICFEPLIEGLVLTRLPCGHLYHQNCAVTWLSRCGSCPECRYELPTDMGAEYEEDRYCRMKSLKYKVVRCACEHQSMGIHTCFFRDKTKLLSEQVTTNERRKHKKRSSERNQQETSQYETSQAGTEVPPST